MKSAYDVQVQRVDDVSYMSAHASLLIATLDDDSLTGAHVLLANVLTGVDEVTVNGIYTVGP